MMKPWIANMIIAILLLIAAYFHLWGAFAGLIGGVALRKAQDSISAYLDRKNPARVCRRKGHIWEQTGGRNIGCRADCQCSSPVHECARCDECDYGNNRDAVLIIDACPTAREVHRAVAR